MILFKKTAALKDHLDKVRKQGKTIGFVPTMGALHEGHISLVNAARAGNTLTIASIFVNPAQFNDKKDFEKYPVTIEKDIEMLVAAGLDILFLPNTKEVYPSDPEQPSHYKLGFIETILEGKYRPGHFQGVAKVMHRLLDIVAPDDLYMGQKDYQQCMVVNRLLDIIHSPARLHPCPILRETDGLAMSSRNMRLQPAERQRAAGISKTLQFIKKHVQPGNTDIIIKEGMKMLTEQHFRVDYVSIANAGTLEPVTEWDGQQKIVALIAAYQDEIRLIDNMLLN